MTWKPTKKSIQNSNIGKLMKKLEFTNYDDLWSWSVQNKEEFWQQTVASLNIIQHKKYDQILNLNDGATQAKWLYGASLNIVDSCFQNDDDATAIVFQKPNKDLQKINQKELLLLVNRIANSFAKLHIKTGDTIAIDLPMTLECVAIYLAAIKAGIKVATIVDSFTPQEIAVRLEITKPKVVFTQDFLSRAGKSFPLYKKVVSANAAKIIVLQTTTSNDFSLREQDLFWDDFLSENTNFTSVKQTPQESITILFSSGTTGEPKAIPWNHTTAIKAASDGLYHQNIQQNDVVCWPTNLGWMMGPWLIFATLLNKATIALYYDAPLQSDFGMFVQNAKVSMLGVIPSIVKHWKNSGCMEPLDWSVIKNFSSTGEVSNPTEMQYLMQLANNKPVIEYCGGTEIGGGYVTSTVVQENIASTFSTKALGSDFVLLDDNHQKTKKGEVFLIPPIMGLSTMLLNKNHHAIYYKDTPKYTTILRRHGDELAELDDGYFKILGRVDDAMNLGGIKVSATQIEQVISTLDFVKECAAIAVAPKDGGPAKLVVFYVCKETKTLSDEDRLLHAQKVVKKQMNPLFKVSDLIKIDVLPRTASNKVMRRTLRDSYKN
ncbi:AMP-dependent synthetase [Polaribacter sp. WD7]|uniref:AMP-binding protein n=1 Tax=Polaribacter sp. WD7 TaxID=2269061 RepID=UPI000DF3830B|nr:AMP-binding protein [Polaribacter sp. WD7]RCS26206.1 AMP-dependent synthetase [Polaribacter sp. WD7]